MRDKEGYWVIRTYKAGSVGEKTKFRVPGKRPDKKLTRRQRSAIKKQQQNEYSAVKRLARTLNHYFTGGDLLLGLDYSSKGMEKLEKWAEGLGINLQELTDDEKRDVLYEAADHELDNCLRRAKRRAKKEGVEIKAALSTSDLEWNSETKTYEPARVHHHLVINKEARDIFVDAWGELGGVSWSPMWDYQDDRTPIAEYIIGQVRKIPDAKKFRTTRNLPPIQGKNRIVLSDAELQVPRGGKLLFRREFSKTGQPQYIRYTLPKYGKAAMLPDPDYDGRDLE